MSYTPIIPASGYAGWKMLNRTMDVQKAAFVNSAEIQRDEEYFREKIGSITTAEDLVADRRLLKVALGAFGLSNDIDNKYFIRKVLEEGTLDSSSLANKMADKTYLKMSEAFGFGDYEVPRTSLSSFADEILTKYETRQFEVAVGDSDNSLRLAMAAQRELPELAAKTSSNDAKWYTVIGSTSLSEVMRTALGLPTSVGSLDVDQQLSMYKDKAEYVFGTSDFSTFNETETMDKLVRNYLVRSQISAGSTMSSQSVALQLLQGSGSSFSILL
ncbi:uncharacterized protein DUF1217 [Rhodobacter aestuarii]|uniref:Flagellar protein n=1 Tax=Rhodobacter aestuarii TaxID=453582 RepID=A0A1N7LKH2_9RHOB|nr:DUF1217 domain-containing protein [Rhodobacter aestuarii]PTV95201.1 uncharacterized protein DUF1217 [Rhodobacter aestuarii]SIS74251.1 Protein of unknown function [Rhodobacter aestuarii]